MDNMFRTAVEASAAGLIMVGADGAIKLMNAEAERMFGYDEGQLIGASIETLVPDQLRASHISHRSGFCQAPSKRSMGVGRDLKAVRRDRSEFPVEIGLTPIQTDDGVAVMAFVVDITARREAEQSIKRYTAELERANEGLARFAYVASHDIQEPLRKIVAFADILTAGVASGNMDDVRYASDVMRESALRARQLVTDLLAFSRSMNSHYDLGAQSVRSAVDGALSNLSQAIQDEQAEISVRIDDFSVLADRTQLTQLIQNIVSNAIKYHRADARPTIDIASRLEPDGARVLSIRDGGVGFEARHAEEIFEPFKRLHTRKEYSGSGIGLAICKTIADRHGWRLAARSTPGVGSQFDIVFASGAPGANSAQASTP